MYSVIWNGKPCNNFKELVDCVRPGIEGVIYNYSELHKAARVNWPIEKVKEIISKNGYKIIRKKTPKGETALHLAAKYNNKEICELLLPKMTLNLINALNNEGKTALECAATTELQDLIKMYCKKRYP